MNDSSTRNTSATNWERIDAMTDEEIDTSDVPPLGEDFFARATLRMPRAERAPVSVHLTVDPDVLAWYQAQGEGYERRMEAALRIYAEAHKTAA